MNFTLLWNVFILWGENRDCVIYTASVNFTKKETSGDFCPLVLSYDPIYELCNIVRRMFIFEELVSLAFFII